MGKVEENLSGNVELFEKIKSKMNLKIQGMKDLNCLQKETKEVLESLVLIPNLLRNYVLVGGSGLAVQLCHRLSEDLDFFTFSDSNN